MASVPPNFALPGLQRRQTNTNCHSTIPNSTSNASFTRIHDSEMFSSSTGSPSNSEHSFLHSRSIGSVIDSDIDIDDNDDCSSTNSVYSTGNRSYSSRRRRHDRKTVPLLTTSDFGGKLADKQQRRMWMMNLNKNNSNETRNISEANHLAIDVQKKKDDMSPPRQLSHSKSRATTFSNTALSVFTSVWNNRTRQNVPPTSITVARCVPESIQTDCDDMSNVPSRNVEHGSSDKDYFPAIDQSNSNSVGPHYRCSNPERKILTTDSTSTSSSTTTTCSGPRLSNTSLSNNTNAANATDNRKSTAIFQLLFGACGIFVTYLYYGNVQEDLFRYRDPVDGSSFTFVWFLQLAESSLTILIGFVGRHYTHKNLPPSKHVMLQQQTLPTFLFFQSGTCQLLGKALMAMSLAAGLSFPVVVLAKSAKVVPVMMGQFVLGGSSYSFRDYLFAILIVAGTALLSFGSSTDDDDTADIDEKTAHATAVVSGKNTRLGLILIFMSLIMDGVTGGLQKKLKRETASMVVTTYDFLFYSHSAMFLVALAISLTTGEFLRGHVFLLKHLNTSESNVLHLLLASCVCSAIGQCFIFYVIATFDPLVCTTVTTTRKMASVLYSIMFKGHNLSYQGMMGLLLGMSALGIEMEQQFSKNSKHTTNSHRNNTGSTGNGSVTNTGSNNPSTTCPVTGNGNINKCTVLPLTTVSSR